MSTTFRMGNDEVGLQASAKHTVRVSLLKLERGGDQEVPVSVEQ